jgi:hypothetical protein
MSDEIDYTEQDYVINNPRAFRPPKKDGESQGVYISRCQEMGYTEEECQEGFVRDA